MADTENVMMKTAYHITQGGVLMYAVDAHQAVASHPDEWSLQPWPARKDVDGEPEPTRLAAASAAKPSSRAKSKVTAAADATDNTGAEPGEAS